MQNGWRVHGAGPLRGLCCPVKGGMALAPKAWGGLRDTGTASLGRAGGVIPGRPCLLCTGGQEAWRRLGPRRSVCWQPVWGTRGRLRRRLPVFLTVAWALLWGLVFWDMRGAGVGSRAGLPLRPAPSVRRIIPQAPGGIGAGGPAPAPVIGVPLSPARLRGRAGRVTAGAVTPPGGGVVSASGGGGAVS